MAERSYKARLERRLALLLEEGLQETSRRRWKRATAVGNNSLQVSDEEKQPAKHFPPSQQATTLKRHHVSRNGIVT